MQTVVCTLDIFFILTFSAKKDGQGENNNAYKEKMEYKDHILQEVIRQVFLSSRRNRGLTQSGLSTISNITRQFISQVEGGKRLPSINTLSTIVNAYNRSLSEFFQEVDRLYPLFESGRFFIHPPNTFVADKPNEPGDYIRNIKKENGPFKG